jgi:hypothetical protein
MIYSRRALLALFAALALSSAAAGVLAAPTLLINAGMTKLVITRLFLRVRQYFKRLIRFFKKLFRLFVVRVSIRVMFHGNATVSLF